jgi:hypothetical protein
MTQGGSITVHHWLTVRLGLVVCQGGPQLSLVVNLPHYLTHHRKEKTNKMHAVSSGGRTNSV